MRNKRKGILMASAILGSAAIVSTGFAAWVVSTNVTETTTGNIVVDDVNDNRVIISEIDLSNDEFVFGAKGSVQDAWLTNDNTDNEKLSTTLTFKASWSDTKKNDAKTPITIYTKLQINGTDWSSFTGDEFNSKTLFEFDTEKNKLTESISCLPGETQSIDIVFKWGSLFNYQNPYVYFNSEDYYGDDGLSNTEINNAVAILNELAKLKSAKFTLSMSNNDQFKDTGIVD